MEAKESAVWFLECQDHLIKYLTYNTTKPVTSKPGQQKARSGVSEVKSLKWSEKFKVKWKV
jgi:hypothetical protein